MLNVPTQCPFCDGAITVTRIYCRDCDTTIEGRFGLGEFAQLTPEQWSFVETFVRYEGKIKHMEDELNLSYPTIRRRLHEVIRAMGYEPGEVDTEELSEDERRKILEDLDAGKISYEEAIQLLDESEV